ncbi:hypothetical protein [Dietzia alimentaria]|uniref:Rv0361 family membrane protein n=1 Tax=Dietzia alimentaria TaxID=665550 RepID=UPI00029B568B|nr:hypothetical protein [Dietzia alimentaria]
MTTTSQQQPAGNPEPGDHSGSGPVGGARPAGGRRGGLGGVLVAVGVVTAVLIAAVVWFFVAGPMSSSARAERDVEQAIRDMTSAETFSEFNSYLCAENRVPQDLVNNITASGEQTGTDLDAMLRESIAGTLPDDLRVTSVEVDDDGVGATANVESDSEGTGEEQVRMRDEDGSWKLCEPGVGMGAVPQTEQPG